MIKRREFNESIVYDLIGYERESDMDIIFNLLSEKYSTKALDKILGPDTIIWKLEIENNSFTLINDNWGNFLRPDGDKAINFIDKEFDVFNEIL